VVVAVSATLAFTTREGAKRPSRTDRSDSGARKERARQCHSGLPRPRNML
jgi:hypothetical protein